MVAKFLRKSDVALFYPGSSLVSQVVEWVRDRRRYCLRLAWSKRPAEIISVVDAAAMTIIEATEHPADAMMALEHVAARMPLPTIATYTERNHPGLEVFVRVRGIILLTGPMSDDRWAAFFQRAEAAWSDAPANVATGTFWGGQDDDVNDSVKFPNESAPRGNSGTTRRPQGAVETEEQGSNPLNHT